MNKEQYRDDDYLGEEEASKEVGISLAMFREANNLYWIRPEYSRDRKFTNTTRFPARANRRIRWFFECGW